MFVIKPLVMGDDGKLYVSKELVAIYRDEVISHADFLFPNQTECEYVRIMLFSCCKGVDRDFHYEC